jgi:hypothetical protein
MAIENAQAVRFCNEQIRILADVLTSAYWTCKAVRANYYAAPELGDLFYAGIAEEVADGSQTDGRPIITGNDVMALITRAEELIAGMEADNNAKLNTLLAAAVNGQGRV